MFYIREDYPQRVNKTWTKSILCVRLESNSWLQAGMRNRRKVKSSTWGAFLSPKWTAKSILKPLSDLSFIKSFLTKLCCIWSREHMLAFRSGKNNSCGGLLPLDTVQYRVFILQVKLHANNVCVWYTLHCISMKRVMSSWTMRKRSSFFLLSNIWLAHRRKARMRSEVVSRFKDNVSSVLTTFLIYTQPNIRNMFTEQTWDR